MKISEYKQIDTRIEEVVVTVIDYDADGNEVGSHEETTQKLVPIMGMVYRDATDEEIAQMQIDDIPIEEDEEPTVADLVEALDILTSIVLGEE